jgi:hypothetical protein
MSMLAARSYRLGALALGVLCALPLAGCKNKGSRGQSELANWIDSPTKGTKDGKTIKIAQLGVKFEIPETLYVFKNCGEASHTPDGSINREWIPVMVCNSSDEDVFGGGGEDEEDEGGGDMFAEEDAADAGAEPIELTFYVTKKTRPIDERAVTWFEGQFKQAGLTVSDISYQHEYHKKAGIYAKLHVGDEGEPEREIIQFMFPREDVVFIARMEYPFGERRSVDKDWEYIMWNFDFTAAAEAG